jgi:hypothetical protein
MEALMAKYSMDQSIEENEIIHCFMTAAFDK